MGRGQVAIGGLYAEDAVHRSMPFRPEHRGKAGVIQYVRSAFSAERAPEVRFREPVVAGDRAVVEFWATLVEEPDAKPVTIAGCALVRFRPDGLVAEARDYCSLAEGHQRPIGTEFLTAP